TYLVRLIDERFGVLDLRLGVLLVEAEAERIGGFLVGVLAENEVLTPHSVVFGVVVDSANVRDLVAGFVSDGVVQNDDSVLRPPRFVALLERAHPLAGEALFVPVVFGEELVESAFALRLENAFRDALDGFIAGSNKARHIGSRVVFLLIREAVEILDELGAGQKLRDRHHRSRSDRFAAVAYKRARSSL